MQVSSIPPEDMHCSTLRSESEGYMLADEDGMVWTLYAATARADIAKTATAVIREIFLIRPPLRAHDGRRHNAGNMATARRESNRFEAAAVVR
jgi:hypothetical protein